MILSVSKSRLKGSVLVPASKSHTIRAVAIASLADGESTIANPLISSDTQSAVDCYRALGAKIDTADPKLWKIIGTAGKIAKLKETIDVGNSGTTLRIAAGSAALAKQGQSIVFTGDQQIRSRPIQPLIDALCELGAECACLNSDGRASYLWQSLRVGGQLRGGRTSIACTTSQYLSSLLLCTPFAENDTEIDVTLLNEPGYVQMTLDWLDKQGIAYENQGFAKFRISGGQVYKGFDSCVPADFSSATFFLCAGAVFGEEVRLVGLDFSDSQPDKAVVDYLKAMGADIRIEKNALTIRAAELEGLEIDMNRTPDALPAMAVTAAFAKGETRLVNVAQARNKETDRIKCVAAELKKMEIDVEELADGLIIRQSEPKAAKLKGYSDHRIVMALSLAGLGSDEKCTIDTAEAMSVTFPGYVELMKSIGANMEII